MSLRWIARILVLACLSVTGVLNAASPATFSETLTAEQRARLGLDKLNPEELRALDAAIAQYRKTGTVEALQRAKAEAEQAKQEAVAAAVEEYKKKEEPGVVARALEIFKHKEADRRQERITGVLLDPFRGWEGSTIFRLDNGQVWQQAASDRYHTKPKNDVAVVIYKAPSGYFRLRVLDDEGAWVTVKRIR
jgi:hypothetical protein